MEPIASLQNDKVKLAYGLQNRTRTRRKERKIVLEGVRLIRDALVAKQKPEFIFYQQDNTDFELVSELQERKFAVFPVTSEVFKHISDTQNSQGIIGVFPLPMPPLPKNPKRVLILDNLRDPGNVGTMLRTAGASGVDVVLLSPGCADPYNPKTLRSGMGAHFRVPVVDAPWDHIAGYCDPLNVYLATGEGDLRYDHVDWTESWALIIGSEAHGSSADAEALAEKHIFIPMAQQTESINAGVAAGVILFEAVRQSLA